MIMSFPSNATSESTKRTTAEGVKPDGRLRKYAISVATEHRKCALSCRIMLHGGG